MALGDADATIVLVIAFVIASPASAVFAVAFPSFAANNVRDLFGVGFAMAALLPSEYYLDSATNVDCASCLVELRDLEQQMFY